MPHAFGSKERGRDRSANMVAADGVNGLFEGMRPFSRLREKVPGGAGRMRVIRLARILSRQQKFSLVIRLRGSRRLIALIHRASRPPSPTLWEKACIPLRIGPR